jgi:hypothetical protein
VDGWSFQASAVLEKASTPVSKFHKRFFPRGIAMITQKLSER